MVQPVNAQGSVLLYQTKKLKHSLLVGVFTIVTILIFDGLWIEKSCKALQWVKRRFVHLYIVVRIMSFGFNAVCFIFSKIWLNVSLGDGIAGKSTVRQFSDEIQVNIEESIRGKGCIFFNPTSSPVNDNLMEI